MTTTDINLSVEQMCSTWRARRRSLQVIPRGAHVDTP